MREKSVLELVLVLLFIVSSEAFILWLINDQ